MRQNIDREINGRDTEADALTGTHGEEESGEHAARRLIAVDLENLLGVEPVLASESCWEVALSGLLASVQYREGTDRLVVGVGHDWVFTVADLAPASARIVTRNGVSGADLALCDELADTSFIARRFEQVIIASGDHEFIPVVRALRGVGITTTVATIPLQASGELAFVADAVVWLERPALRLRDTATVGVTPQHRAGRLGPWDTRRTFAPSPGLMPVA